jgi:hypothetical protein
MFIEVTEADGTRTAASVLCLERHVYPNHDVFLNRVILKR